MGFILLGKRKKEKTDQQLLKLLNWQNSMFRTANEILAVGSLFI